MITSRDESSPCPAPGVLSRFVEGTLDSGPASDLAAHIAACTECRFVVGETAAFLGEMVVTSKHDTAEKTAGRRWLPLAAASAIGLTLWVTWIRDIDARFDREIRKTGFRVIEARLSDVLYAKYSARRGDPTGVPERLRAVAAAVLADDDPSSAGEWHRRGVASLLNGQHESAAASFSRATKLAPSDPAFWNDLAATRIALGTSGGDARLLDQATADAQQALRIDPTLPEARFNLAVALERRGLMAQAADAYDQYLALDAHSSWADEVRDRRAAIHR